MTKLKVVTEGEEPAKSEKLSVKQAADSGTRRDLLVAMRSRIAQDIDNPRTPARDLAALTRRLLEIAKDIESIDAEDNDDDIGAAASTPDEKWSAG